MVLRELMLFVYCIKINYNNGQGVKDDNVVCYLVFK